MPQWQERNREGIVNTLALLRYSIELGAASVLLGALSCTPAQAQTSDIPACGVELRIHTTSPVVRAVDDALHLQEVLVAELVNAGSDAVTLVLPGDGSESGWRTPIVRWEVTRKGYTPPQMLRCGNVNSLMPGEVFDLPPGGVRRLENWIPSILGVKSGTYRLRLIYINDPTLEWQGLPDVDHDFVEMGRVKRSTPCRVESNEISVRVRK